MATKINVKGEAIENAVAYDLYEKNSDGTYTHLAEDLTADDGIEINLTALGLAVGSHTLVVKARGDGVSYSDSPYSNELTYTVAAQAFLNLDFTSKTVQDYIDDGVLSLGDSTANSLTYDAGGLVCNDTDLANGLKLATPISVAQSWTVEITMSVAAYADSGTSLSESLYNNFAILSNNDDHESHGSTCLAPVVMNNGGKGTVRLAENVSTAVAISASTFALDGVEHTYKFTFDAATGALEMFVDGTSVGTRSWAIDTTPVAGSFGYVLGIHKGYSYANSYRSKLGYKIKSVKVYS